MPPPSSDDTPSNPGDYLEMDFRSAEFPSDTLSVKRLRKIFPQHFDTPGAIIEGYFNNDFFFPVGPEEPRHLLQLTELICAERTVASDAFYERIFTGRPDVSYDKNDEETTCVEDAKQTLEKEYQYFKLADSPETARLLIRQVEEAGDLDARRQMQGKSR